MGNKQSVFTQEQLDKYQEATKPLWRIRLCEMIWLVDCTHLNVKEIIRLYKKFFELSPDVVPHVMSDVECKEILLSPEIIKTLPELKDNPFSDQVIKVFSDQPGGCFNFENFLEMFNVFNEKSSRDVKTHYAFKIHDADEDDNLNKHDLAWTVKRLTREQLTETEVNLVVDKVLEEAEMDDDMQISFMEFEHVVYRSPDFLSTFRISV